jgi:hypothetical protein
MEESCMSIETRDIRGKNRTGLLPFQMDLLLLEELYPVMVQNTDPVFLRNNNQIIDTKFNGRNYIFIDDDYAGGGETAVLPEGKKIGYKVVFQNDRDITVIIRLPEKTVTSTEEKWIAKIEYEENKNNFNFINENIINNMVLVNPKLLIEAEDVEIPPSEMREARWNGKTWVFRKPLVKRTVILEENPFEINTEEKFIKITQDYQVIFIKLPRDWDCFQFLNQTETVTTVKLQKLIDGIQTENWKENGDYETITINPNCMVYAYWHGIEWEIVAGFEDEKIMQNRIEELESKIVDGEIDAKTQDFLVIIIESPILSMWTGQYWNICILLGLNMFNGI